MKFFWKIAILCALGASLVGITPALAKESGAEMTLAPDSVLQPKGAAANALKPGQLLDRSGKVLEGNAVCMHCHDEQEQKPLLSILKTRHGVKADSRTPSCQGCHGVSDSHIHNVDATKIRSKPDVTYGPNAITDPQTQSETCLTCHQGGKRMHWAGSQHQGRDIPCTSCHVLHTADDKVLSKQSQREVCFKCHKTEQAQTHRISTHPLDAGKMSCTDCHNPHGSVGPKLLAKNTLNETCYTCHAEKRGPFLWEHPPVSEDCSNCHTPHGSNIAPLLKSRPPFLCQSCHDYDHAASAYSGRQIPVANGGNYGSTTSGTAGTNMAVVGTGALGTRAQLLLRGCANCHSQVHGSNHPSGFELQR